MQLTDLTTNTQYIIMAKFTKELLESANEILCDNTLDIFQKNEELEEMLLDEGYDMDDMVDLLFSLSWMA